MSGLDPTLPETFQAHTLELPPLDLDSFLVSVPSRRTRFISLSAGGSGTLGTSDHPERHSDRWRADVVDPNYDYNCHRRYRGLPREGRVISAVGEGN